tara:strand:- start:170 stop:1483 length:1314 start_codon:yes stop_codon:yes gene_type:complete
MGKKKKGKKKKKKKKKVSKSTNSSNSLATAAALIADTKVAEPVGETREERAERIETWRRDLETAVEDREAVLHNDAETHRDLHSHHRARRVATSGRVMHLAHKVHDLRLAASQQRDAEHEILLLQHRTAALKAEISAKRAAWKAEQDDLRVGMASLRLTIEQEAHSVVESVRASLLAEAHAEFAANAADASEWNEVRHLHNQAKAKKIHRRLHQYDARSVHLHELRKKISLVDGEVKAQSAHVRKIAVKSASHRKLVVDLHASIARMEAAAREAEAEAAAGFIEGGPAEPAGGDDDDDAPSITLAERSAAAVQRSHDARGEVEEAHRELRNWRFRALRAVRLLEAIPPGSTAPRRSGGSGSSSSSSSSARPNTAAAAPATRGRRGRALDPLRLTPSRPAASARAKERIRERTSWLRAAARPQTAVAQWQGRRRREES